MTGIVETDLAFFAGVSGPPSFTDCNQITDWSPTVTLDTELKVQGSGCVGIKVSNITNLITFSISGTVSLTSTMIYFWAMFADPLARLATKAGGGLGIRIESSATDYVEWYIAGKDTWSGGWKAFAIHTDTPPEVTGGSVVKESINKISIRWTTTAAAKVSPNCYWDAIRFGKVLKIRSGTPSSPASFQDLLDAEKDTENKYGILEEIEGILMCQGRLQFGSTFSTEATYFKDESKVLVFTEGPNTFPVDYFQIDVKGNSGTFTTVLFGSEVDSSGISGCAFRTAAAPKYKFLADDPNISTLGLYGCSFFDASTIKVPDVYSSAFEIENTNFERGAKIIPNECKFLNCNFISADDIAADLPLDHNISLSRFINNPIALYVNTGPGTLSLDAEAMRKIETGRWKIVNNQLIIYDTNGVTPLYVFNLKDKEEQPTEEQPYERVPV